MEVKFRSFDMLNCECRHDHSTSDLFKLFLDNMDAFLLQFFVVGELKAAPQASRGSMSSTKSTKK